MMASGLTEEEIGRRLARALGAPERPAGGEHELPHELWSAEPRPAAVLIPLLRQEDAWHLLFTRRTATLAEHSDQVAFPGGRSDPDDTSPEETALREAYEEIRLKPEDVRIIGRLKELRTISNYCVTPVVGRIPWPYSFRLALKEVSRVFTIPLAWLAERENHEIRLRELPHPYPPVPVVYFRLYHDELLWGISAQLTLDLLSALRLI
jgi:8-oxo-dGTP pyrophosphatase MutT (NUDIX family)